MVASLGWMQPPKCYVYVLQSISNPARHYTGLTSRSDGRLEFHNAGLSYHTAKYRPWRLKVLIKFADQQVAARFERYLKTGSGRAFAKRHFST
jgi:predicted GIY-YIG superfamily endonuclease